MAVKPYLTAFLTAQKQQINHVSSYAWGGGIEAHVKLEICSIQNTSPALNSLEIVYFVCFLSLDPRRRPGTQ